MFLFPGLGSENISAKLYQKICKNPRASDNTDLRLLEIGGRVSLLQA